jgi:acyl dehydratase
MTVPDRYFDDLAIGDAIATASITVTREDAIEFARRYDPQPFHLDDEAARKSVFGRLALSGWQTVGYAMRLLVETKVFHATGILGTGVDELRWPAPTYPGDTLTAKSEIITLTPDPKGKPRGLVTLQVSVFNQDGTCVLAFKPTMTMIKRP